jgi:hypothetical protein
MNRGRARVSRRLRTCFTSGVHQGTLLLSSLRNRLKLQWQRAPHSSRIGTKGKQSAGIGAIQTQWP